MSDNRYNGQFRPEFSRLHHDKDLWWVIPFRVRYILGLAGKRWSGKSTVVAYLVEKQGFQVYTLSMTLRRLAQEVGEDHTSREALQNLGDQLRSEYGPGYLASRTLRAIRADHLAHRASPTRAARLVVAGFKRPEEVAVFDTIKQFHLTALCTDADRDRYERARKSGAAHHELGRAPGTVLTDADIFEGLDRRDRFGLLDGDEYGQAVEKVLGRVREDRVILNNGTETSSLLAEVAARVARLDKEYRLPRGG